MDKDGRIYREVGIAHDVTEMKEAEAKLLDLSRRFNNVVEEERSAIARDLHDEFGQALVRLRQWQKTMNEALPLSSRPLVNNDDFNGIVNHLGKIVRHTTHRLRPDILDNLGLAAAIEHEVKDFRSRFQSVAATFRLMGQPRPINREHALVFYRVLQEALTNIARHARAKTVRIRLIFSFPTIILTVDDDGVGFDPAGVTSLAPDGIHLGLRGIVERMSTIGGRARITTHPGKGTKVRAELTTAQQTPANPDWAGSGGPVTYRPTTENNHE